MRSSNPSADESVTVLVYDSDGDTYASLIRKHFPDVRVLIAENLLYLEYHVAEADVILSSAGRFPIHLFEVARRLRWFQSTGAGIDPILPIRDRLGHLIITNARGLHGEMIADFVMAGIGMLHWKFPQFMREQSCKQWHTRSVPPIAERTLGVVGLGSIGAAIAQRAKDAGLRVVGSKRDVTKPLACVDRLLSPDSLSELLMVSDFVVLAVPHVPETNRLVGREQLRLMRRDAFLINVARGSVVAENELIEALQEGIIAGALLDVFEREPLPPDSPLWTMPNVIVTPHVAGSSTNYAASLFHIFSDNLQRFLDKKPLHNIVDLSRGY